MNIRSDLILITGDSKHQHGPPVRVRTYQFQVKSGGSLAQVWLTVGPVNPWTHPMVIPTVPKCTIQCKYTHIDASICGEIQVENSETAFFPNPVQNSKSKAIKLPAGMAEKNPKVCILTSIYFTSLASAKTRQVLKDDSRWYHSTKPKCSCCTRCGIFVGPDEHGLGYMECSH